MTTTVQNTTSSSSSSSVGTAAASATSLGKDDFLKLLLAQLQNQDPTSPTDDTAFVAQLAQFSQVEQLQDVNSNLTTMLTGQASASETQAASLVGKSVSFQTQGISLTTGNSTTVSGSLSGDATSVTAIINDSNGNPVRTLKLGAQGAGPISFVWNGRNDLGQALPTGTYQVSFDAKNSSGGTLSVATQGSGVVTGVSFTNGYPELLIGSQRVKLANVSEIDSANP